MALIRKKNVVLKNRKNEFQTYRRTSLAEPETGETFDDDYDSKENGIKRFKQAEQDLLNGNEMTLEEFITHRGS